MKRVLKLPLAVAFIVGCQDPGVQPPAGDFSAIIVDAVHEDGNGAFFWLPPSVPDPSGFGTFDPNVRPTIEICPLVDDTEENPGPGGFVCAPPRANRRETTRAVDARFSPSEIDGASDHYHVKFDTKSVRRNRLYRIIASIGSTEGEDPNVEGDADDIVLAELGIRDVGIGNVACSDDQNDPILCISGQHQIKFRIDQDAICFDGPVLLLLTCAGGTLTSGGQSFVLGPGGVQGATPSGTELSLVFNEVDCEPGSRVIGLEDGGFHPMQWALYGPCFKVTTSPVITNLNIEDLLEGGLLGYEICVDHPGMTPTQKARARLARMSTDRTELQILARDDAVDVVDTCSPAVGAGLGAKIWKFARGLFHKVGGPFAPEPVYAARGFFRRGDFGVGGRGLKSFVGVVMPGVLSNVTTLDLGVRSPGESIPVVVQVKDVGGEFIEDNDVTFKTTDGDTFNGADSTVVRTPASGLAAGNWVLANNAAGTRTLTASCFPCGNPPVTGDDGDPDPFEDLTLSDSQTFTFTATVLSLSVLPLAKGGTVGETFDLTFCIGEDVDGVTIQFAGRANNGTPTTVDPPQVVTGTEPAIDPAPGGCYTVPITVNKSGGIRIIVTLVGTDQVVESTKINIRPKKN